jgi:hypothetical protein
MVGGEIWIKIRPYATGVAFRKEFPARQGR